MLVTLRKSIALLLLLIASISLFAEEGEMLRFNAQVNLDIAIQSSAASSAESVLYASAASSLSEHPFDRILLNGKIFSSDIQAEKSALMVQISLNRDGVWTVWKDAPLEVFPNGRFWARADINRSAKQLRYRLVARAATKIEQLHIYAVEGLDSRKIDERNRRVQEEKAEPFSFRQNRHCAKTSGCRSPAMGRKSTNWFLHSTFSIQTNSAPYRWWSRSNAR